MIVLWFLTIALLSFTRITTWLQVALTLALPVLMSVLTRDPIPVKVAGLALVGALVLYAPLVLLASFIVTGGFRVALRRFRFIYFIFVLLLFVLLAFNMTQLV
jgi:hypothetical protein